MRNSPCSHLPNEVVAPLPAQVRNIALTCTADLMKAPQAHRVAFASPDFASHLLAALKVDRPA